ncbi:branched-chain amino acid ABC transporter substrate-binding protein [Desulfovirgula thermocuniculi]|uniref:branched-chain amino acid ABC transporter substrate-binding protein n=1 Tax=Desulfovirgula thermocuniculi TaxID=348842 RepID=UPI0004084CAD|nr:branched-chain amino acid ABC transporter substrate-binding protein [Desulfovirgula thermocuniculi]
MLKKLLVVMVAAALVVAAAGCAGGGKSDTIKIGVQGPISGDWALEGQGFVKAVTMLAEQINAKGGLLGKKIEIVQGDDKGDPKEASLVAQKMVSSKVIAVLGAYNSSATEPAAGIYNEAKILHITPSSTATKLTEKGYKMFFRTCFLDNRQGMFAADFIVNTLGKKKVALIHDNTTYAKGLADWTEKFLKEKGATVVFNDAITPKEKDFTSTLTKIKGLDPEVIYFTGYFSEGGLLLRQARELGIKAVFMAGDANNNPDFVKNAGLEAAKGAIITTLPLPQDLPYKEAKQFIADYKAKYGKEPESIWTLTMADAFRVVVEAIEKTKSTDPVKLAEYLHTQLKDFPGITGPITFDEKGDRLGSVHTAYVVNEKGEFVLYKKQ